MEMWDDPAVARRMEHLAELVRRKPGTEEDKAALDSIMGVAISVNDPCPPPYRKEDHYATAIITPQKAKADGDNRMKGDKVLKAALEMSIHDGNGLIIDAITQEPLDTAYDLTHTLAFSTSEPDRRVFEQATGQFIDTSHVDCRRNKIALSTGMHRIDTIHTLLRFPVFIDPDTRQPVLSLRVASIVDWNLKHEAAERRNAYDELLPRAGKESIGTLFWAIETNTLLQYRTLYDLDGMNPFQCPVKYGIFYRSQEDPFAVICNTAHNMRVLQHGKRGMIIDHLCPWGQQIIVRFRQLFMGKLTDGTRAENPDTFYAGLAAITLKSPVKVPERLVYADPRASLSPGSTVDASSYAPSPRGSEDSESDDDSDTRATPSPPETRRMTLGVRMAADKVRDKLDERRKEEEEVRKEAEERARKEEEEKARKEEEERARKEEEEKARHAREELERELRWKRKQEYLRLNASILAHDEADYYFNLAYRDAGPTFDPASSTILQDFRMHEQAHLVASCRRRHVTRSVTKGIKSELAALTEDDVYESDDESPGPNAEVPVAQTYVAPSAPLIPFSDASLNPSTSSYTADVGPTVGPSASSTAPQAEDDIPDTSGIATPKQSSISLQDDDAPSTPPVAGPSGKSTTVVLNNPITTGTEPQDNPVAAGAEPQNTVVGEHAFTFFVEREAATPLPPPTVSDSGSIARGSIGRGGSRTRSRGIGGFGGAAGPSRPTAAGSAARGNNTRRGGTGARRGRGQSPTRRSTRQAAIKEKKRKAPDYAADEGYEKEKKKRRSQDKDD